LVQAKTFKQQASIIAQIAEAERFLAFQDELFGIEKGSNQYTVVIESGGQKRDCLGTFGPERWGQLDLESREFGTALINEISLKAEHLNGTPREIYGTLTHEHVHKHCFDLGIKDCSKGGAHSKKEFKPRAEEHGLDCWKSENRPGKAYAFTALTDDMWERILSEFKPNIEVWDMAKHEVTKESKPSSMQSLKCGCTTDDDDKKLGSTVSMSRVEVQTRLDADELPYCKRCKQDFAPQA
jgi:hypothetical protein